MTYQIINQDILQWCREYKGHPFMALLADPPYGIGFLNQKWDVLDKSQFGVAGREGVNDLKVKKNFKALPRYQSEGIQQQMTEWFTALSEHLYPGAFLMVFASARGWHRVAVGIEDAGLIMFPSIFCWGQAAGFPKVTRIRTGEEIDTGKTETLSDIRSGEMHAGHDTSKTYKRSIMESTGLQKVWEGHRYGLQSLKPAAEMILVFQKPYSGRPVDCIIKTGAGALNIDAARIGSDVISVHDAPAGTFAGGEPNRCSDTESYREHRGRWPSNLVIQHHFDCERIGTKTIKGYTINRWSDGSKPFGGGAGHPYEGEQQPDEEITEWRCVPECAVYKLGLQGGVSKTVPHSGDGGKLDTRGQGWGFRRMPSDISDEGTCARYFFNADWTLEQLENADPVIYCAKAGKREKDAGLEAFEEQETPYGSGGGAMPSGNDNPVKTKARNPHPTVKPLSLVRHLATLLLPPVEYAPRRILIPFSGVMSEGIGAMMAGFEEIVGIEMSEEYCRIGEARMAWWSGKNSVKQTNMWEAK